MSRTFFVGSHCWTGSRSFDFCPQARIVCARLIRLPHGGFHHAHLVNALIYQRGDGWKDEASFETPNAEGRVAAGCFKELVQSQTQGSNWSYCGICLTGNEAMAPYVIVADADGELCDLYEQYFSRFDWRVKTVSGALECLELFRDRLPDVLILDLRLPWGGADGLLAVMREEPELARIPVILTCNGLSPNSLDNALLSPAVKPIRKPFSLRTLFNVMCESSGVVPSPSWKERLEKCLTN
jgi:CheY-like chemotaxis protein